MEILKKQTNYKCSYCGRKYMSKPGVKYHEKLYCKNPGSPHMMAVALKQANCRHKHIDTRYAYILGEAVKEPSYDLCLDCEKIL